mmetsp:Transcript_118069/g.241366  ORF Transcript_118069/g.241366 Transcript_118069/m.241366 type:complete len:266 (+) Transcript_118069:476-1273(+)
MTPRQIRRCSATAIPCAALTASRNSSVMQRSSISNGKAPPLIMTTEMWIGPSAGLGSRVLGAVIPPRAPFSAPQPQPSDKVWRSKLSRKPGKSSVPKTTLPGDASCTIMRAKTSSFVGFLVTTAPSMTRPWVKRRISWKLANGAASTVGLASAFGLATRCWGWRRLRLTPGKRRAASSVRALAERRANSASFLETCIGFWPTAQAASSIPTRLPGGATPVPSSSSEIDVPAAATVLDTAAVAMAAADATARRREMGWTTARVLQA